MADTSTWHNQQSQNPAVVDLGDMEMEIVDKDDSDYETNFPDSRVSQKSEQKNRGGGYMEDMKKRFKDNVTSMMFDAGTQKAKKAWDIYGNIDILRPYFNVEPHEVRSRLLYSMFPQKPTDQRQRVPRELYGPLMVIFTMIALLLLQMKTADHKVEEGTLMGTAFGVCFTYWIGASSFVWFLCYICNCHMTMLQILSMMGYGLFGHCIVIFLGTIIHTSHDHIFFYLLWAVFGGISTLRMMCIVISRTHGHKQRMIVCGAIAALHLLFLLYLHFAYHQVVEDLSEVFGHIPAINHPAPQSLQQEINPKVEEGVEQVNDSVLHVVRKAINGVIDSGKTIANSSVVENTLKYVNDTVDIAMRKGLLDKIQQVGRVDVQP